MKKVATRVLGIEIGSHLIKMIEVIKRGEYLTVQRYSILHTPPNCICNGIISKKKVLYKVISEELKSQKYKARKVVAIVQSSHIIIRNILMEPYAEKTIKQLLEIKPETFLPIEKKQYQVDYKILGKVEQEEVKNKLEVVAAPNDIIFPLAELMEDLKIKPICISIPSEALANIFTLEPRMIYDENKNIMIIDMGGCSTTVTIIAENGEVLTRIISSGVEDANTGGLRFYDLDSKEMETFEEYFLTIMKPQIESRIVPEIEKILHFYYANYQAPPIKKIYLIGGGANINGLRAYLRDILNTPTKKVNQLDFVHVAPKIEFEKYIGLFVNIIGAIRWV